MRFTSRYPFTPRGVPRLEIVRNMTWSEVIVRLDRVELGRTDAETLVNGVEYPLRDGSVLKVWLEYGPRRVPFLHVTRNGRPLPGSAGDPAKIVRETLWTIVVIAALQIGYASLGLTSWRDTIPITIMGSGVLLLLLTLLAWRRSSLTAIKLATAVCFIEVAVFFGALAEWNIGRGLPLLFALYLVGWLLFRGVTAMRDLNADRLPIRRPPGLTTSS